MSDNVTSLSAARDVADQAAVRALAERLAAGKEELARRVVACWRQEIVDYRSPADRRVLEDASGFAIANVDALVASLQTGRPVPEEHFERTRDIAARRVHQGVSLESFLRADRVWADVCWEMVLSLARCDVAPEREAALEIAGRITRLADQVATAATGAFLDEIAGRGLLRHDLLDALLAGHGDGQQTMRLARLLRLRLAASYIVVIIRGDGVHPPAGREDPPAARRTLDRIIDHTRRHLRPSAGSLLTGLRNGDVVVLFPTSAPADLTAVRTACAALATTLDPDISIGISGWHEGRPAIATAFAEAIDAVTIADTTGIHGRAVGIDDVLIHAILDSSTTAQRILTETLRPLADYDTTRNAALIPTLRAYVATRLSITKSAASLYVNPNTVVYRLRRIRDVSGRDPHDPDDLLVLSLALKLTDLRSSG